MSRETETGSRPDAPSETGRGEWLDNVAGHMRAWFDELGFPLPPFEIRSGFHSAGKRSSTIAESWIRETDQEEESYLIFVRPDHPDEIEVAAALAHQLCKIAVGRKDSFGHLFRHLAISIGLKGKQSESPPGTVFKELIKPVLAESGPMPQSTITPAVQGTKPRQTTRMIKVTCRECGYVARVSRKWLVEVGPPLCPMHGVMTPSD